MSAEDVPTAVRIITIDGRRWRTALDFLSALHDAINPPEIDVPLRSGLSPDAFVDMMIWGGMGCIEPPYEIRVMGSEHAPEEVRNYISLMIEVLANARKWKLDNYGEDTEVSMHVCR